MDTDALNTVVSELNRAVEELQGEQEPALDELVEWARKLPEITYALVYGTRALRDNVMVLGNRFVMSDDRGREPEESLIETADALRALSTLIERADPSARDFCDSIRHISVERQLAPGEPPSLQVRTSTAADMARRAESSSTPIEKEPDGFMNDTVFGRRIRP